MYLTLLMTSSRNKAKLKSGQTDTNTVKKAHNFLL
jgi:hypothetical protein